MGTSTRPQKPRATRNGRVVSSVDPAEERARNIVSTDAPSWRLGCCRAKDRRAGPVVAEGAVAGAGRLARPEVCAGSSEYGNRTHIAGFKGPSTALASPA